MNSCWEIITSGGVVCTATPLLQVTACTLYMYTGPPQWIYLGQVSGSCFKHVPSSGFILKETHDYLHCFGQQRDVRLSNPTVSFRLNWLHPPPPPSARIGRLYLLRKTNREVGRGTAKERGSLPIVFICNTPSSYIINGVLRQPGYCSKSHQKVFSMFYSPPVTILAKLSFKAIHRKKYMSMQLFTCMSNCTMHTHRYSAVAMNSKPMRPKARGLAQHGGPPRLASWRRVTRQV